MRFVWPSPVLLAFATPLYAEPLQDMPLYQSVEDPAGQQPTRILAEGGVLHFGGIESGRDNLQHSDLGFVMYFVRVDGGVRVRGEPLIFPDGSREHFDWEDFSCSAPNADAAINVVCRRKSDGQLFHSTVANGGLVSFDLLFRSARSDMPLSSHRWTRHSPYAHRRELKDSG